MSLFETYGKEIFSLVVPLIAWILNTFFKAKVRLLLARPHAFTFLVQQPLIDAQGNQISPTQTAHTNSFVITNSGRETATKVELVFNWKPLCINIWPSRHYDERIDPDGRYAMIFNSLAPHETLGFELLSINYDLPALLTARSDQCVAQKINMYPQRVIENWKRRTVSVLVFTGLFAVVYAVILLLQFLILKTPYGH